MAGSERSPGGDEAVLTRWLVVLVIAGIVGMVALAAVTDNDAEMLPILSSFVTAAVATVAAHKGAEASRKMDDLQGTLNGALDARIEAAVERAMERRAARDAGAGTGGG